jgi:hypothetical protein
LLLGDNLQLGDGRDPGPAAGSGSGGDTGSGSNQGSSGSGNKKGSSKVLAKEDTHSGEATHNGSDWSNTNVAAKPVPEQMSTPIRVPDNNKTAKHNGIHCKRRLTEREEEPSLHGSNKLCWSEIV